MPRITISYRRADSLDITGRIFDRLAEHFGREAVFRDIDNIPPGADFRRHIERVLDESDIVLAIVGPRWIGPDDKHRRLASPADPVRIEIETALCKKKPLIPVLVSRAVMPHPDALPDSIHDFAYRNALQVDSGQDFEVHVGRLIRAMERILRIDEERAADQAVQGHAAVKQAALRIKPTPKPQPLVDPIGLALVLMLGVIGVGSWWVYVEQPAEMARQEEQARQAAAAKAQQEEKARQAAAAKAQQEEQARQSAAAKARRADGLETGRWAIQTADGIHFLTADQGGGLTGAATAISTTATTPGPNETFQLVIVSGGPKLDSPGAKFALRTSKGYYITAVNGGGSGWGDARFPIHTDASWVNGWETFNLAVDWGHSPPTVTIQTWNGRFLTAVGGGGVGSLNDGAPIHSDVSRIGAWELFSVVHSSL
jgi:hypothetical protein